MNLENTVEPLNIGHIEVDHLSFVEGLSSFRGENVLPLYILYSECPLSEVPFFLDRL